MEMTLRWFGKKFDSVTLEQIRQIPGVEGVITTLYDIPAGEVWPLERILKLQSEVNEIGLKISGIESVNIHDAIKTGDKSRDYYIDNYIETLKNLGESGIRMVCYNFMPVFDWTRSDLAKKREDGSTVLSYDQDIIDAIDPEKMFGAIEKKSNGFILPGWEPERLGKVKELFKQYREVDDEKLFHNLVYFLKAIRPVCEKYGIHMAIHPDDPAWPVFKLPRIVTGKESILRILKAVDSEFNGITLCTGSLGSKRENDICDIIKAAQGRIHFAHLRNIRHLSAGKFDEAAHLSRDGSLDMYAIVKTLYGSGFCGPVRPDHGRSIWGEKSMPGYGLYDRALGACYLNGLIEAAEKEESESV
ncbi:mannonate dehydratase [Anaerocolumna xylanovorans]|uniref:Mannonate dehydratase n=1 Tax=Anaerocolumna xylanovorans DSM 12503 TaxID=1121345 RepID=A0A1M7YF02_9FIRM|nr:mannonate dehydratase [Anaerocolumna xylanovorans]SHO51166.1 mannonate dehydratase [Anaerocolumna xylanovorans DSM 12503]